MHMLRYVMGDDKFSSLVKDFPNKYAWKSVQHRGFPEDWPRRRTARACAIFFLQWIESSGAPEFKLDYTIYRTPKGPTDREASA